MKHLFKIAVNSLIFLKLLEKIPHLCVKLQLIFIYFHFKDLVQFGLAKILKSLIWFGKNPCSVDHYRNIQVCIRVWIVTTSVLSNALPVYFRGFFYRGYFYQFLINEDIEVQRRPLALSGMISFALAFGIVTFIITEIRIYMKRSTEIEVLSERENDFMSEIKFVLNEHRGILSFSALTVPIILGLRLSHDVARGKSIKK